MCDLLEELLEGHLPLGHQDDVLDGALVPLQVHVPHLLTQSSANLSTGKLDGVGPVDDRPSTD